MARESQRAGGSEKARLPLIRTTDNDGHAHTFRPGDTRTSVNAGHHHRIIFDRIQRNMNDGHRHDVMGEVAEVE